MSTGTVVPARRPKWNCHTETPALRKRAARVQKIEHRIVTNVRTSSPMTSLDSESSQILDGLGVAYEELLFYEKYHVMSKQVRLLQPIQSLPEMLTHLKLLLGMVTILLNGETPHLARQALLTSSRLHCDI